MPDRSGHALINLCWMSLGLLVASLSASAETKGDPVPSVQVSQVTVNKIRLNCKEGEIYRILGKPDKVIRRKPNEVIEGKARDLYYSGLKIYLVGGEILHLECQGLTCITDKGIRMGDSRAKVEQAYGAAPFERNANGGKIYYAFKAGNTFLDSALVFHFKDGKVTRIEYIVDYT